MAKVLFVLGQAASGKSQFARKFIKAQLKKKHAWCLMDKDTSGARLSDALMRALGFNPNDKDSPDYKQHVRDLEYQTCLDIAKEQLRLGLNVVIPGPWTKEIHDGTIFDAEKLGFPFGTKLAHVYVDTPLDELQTRVINRNKTRDEWKLNNWEEYSKSLLMPQAQKDRNIHNNNNKEEFDRLEREILRQYKR
jgi:predicted kinase